MKEHKSYVERGILAVYLSLSSNSIFSVLSLSQILIGLNLVEIMESELVPKSRGSSEGLHLK